MQKRLLIIEDEEESRHDIHLYLTLRGYEVVTVADGGSGMRQLELTTFDLIVLNLPLPDMNAKMLAYHVRSTAPTTLILLISAAGDRHEVLGLLQADAYDFLAKPFDLHNLEQRILAAFMARRQLQYQMGRRREFQRREVSSRLLLGLSEPIQALFGEISRASLGRVPVVFLGEAGSGRQIAARLLLKLSGQTASCMEVDAARLSPADVEAKLKAFLGQPRANRSLLLENLQCLSPQMQWLIYRSVRDAEVNLSQEKEMTPGYLVVTAVDASGYSPQEASPLLLPPAGCVLRLPPLREHMQDLPCIVDQLIARVRGHYGKPVLGVESEAMRRLMSYAWPGNLPELEQVLEAAVRHSENRYLSLADLPAHLRHEYSNPGWNSVPLVH